MSIIFSFKRKVVIALAATIFSLTSAGTAHAELFECQDSVFFALNEKDIFGDAEDLALDIEDYDGMELMMQSHIMISPFNNSAHKNNFHLQAGKGAACVKHFDAELLNLRVNLKINKSDFDKKEWRTIRKMLSKPLWELYLIEGTVTWDNKEQPPFVQVSKISIAPGYE